MWLWLVCIFQLAFADETLRIAVLEFQTVQTMDPNFMLQLSDETRGGALDVFPPSTSKVSVLTRENLMDVLTQQGKDASCMEGNCAVGIGRNIGARFVVVGSVAQVEGVYRLTLGVYDSDSNDLLGQKSIQESSQVKLLGEVRPFAEGLIEQTLGGFDEGRLGVRKIGESDTWTVSDSTQGVLELSEPRLQGAKISVNGRKVCDMRDKSICRALVEQGNVSVSIERQYCDVFTETVLVERLSTLEPAMVCRFAVFRPESDWDLTKLDGKLISRETEIEFGTHEVYVETKCSKSTFMLQVDESGNKGNPQWKDKLNSVPLTHTDFTNQTVKLDVDVPICLSNLKPSIHVPTDSVKNITASDVYFIDNHPSLAFGKHTLSGETQCRVMSVPIFVDKEGISGSFRWNEKMENIQVQYTDIEDKTEKFDVSLPRCARNVVFGKEPVEVLSTIDDELIAFILDGKNIAPSKLHTVTGQTTCEVFEGTLSLNKEDLRFNGQWQPKKQNLQIEYVDVLGEQQIRDVAQIDLCSKNIQIESTTSLSALASSEHELYPQKRKQKSVQKLKLDGDEKKRQVNPSIDFNFDRNIVIGSGTLMVASMALYYGTYSTYNNFYANPSKRLFRTNRAFSSTAILLTTLSIGWFGSQLVHPFRELKLQSLSEVRLEEQ